MEEQFAYWEVENTRISAYDGRDDDLSDIIAGKYPDNMSSGEIGCVTSHLKAIKYWLENSDAEYAIMMEDDCDLEVVKHKPFTGKTGSVMLLLHGTVFRSRSLILPSLFCKCTTGSSTISLQLLTLSTVGMPRSYYPFTQRRESTSWMVESNPCSCR